MLQYGSSFHAPVASSSNAFNYLCTIGAEWLELACVCFVTRSGFRPFDFIGIAHSRKQLCPEVCLGIGLVLGVAEAIYTILPPLFRTLHASRLLCMCARCVAVVDRARWTVNRPFASKSGTPALAQIERIRLPTRRSPMRRPRTQTTCLLDAGSSGR